jgi:hypothetical protein
MGCVFCCDVVCVADTNGLSDPYCVLRVGSHQRERTGVQAKTLNPEWNESFALYVWPLSLSLFPPSPLMLSAVQNMPCAVGWQ